MRVRLIGEVGVPRSRSVMGSVGMGGEAAAQVGALVQVLVVSQSAMGKSFRCLDSRMHRREAARPVFLLLSRGSDTFCTTVKVTEMESYALIIELLGVARAP
jgi:hypothetical protein